MKLHREIENLQGSVKKAKTNENWNEIEQNINSMIAVYEVLINQSDTNTNAEIDAAKIGLDGTKYATLKSHLNALWGIKTDLKGNYFNREEINNLLADIALEMRDINNTLANIITDTSTMISTAKIDIYQKVDDKLASKQDKLILSPYSKVAFTTGGMQGELRYRTYGKMVEIEGSMVNWRLSQGLGTFATAPKWPGYTRRYPIYSIDKEVQEGVIEINSNGEMILIKNPAMGSQYSFSFNYFDN